MQGIINVLKPTGLTSSDVVVRIRGLIRSKYGLKIKVGHLGTLDPGAAGVLPIAIGSATKLFDILKDKRKLYRVSVTFGISTETIDSYGNILKTTSIIPDEKEFRKVIKEFVGKITQVPPMYSAINVNGKRAYQLAREGISVDLKSREVQIYSIKYLEKKSHNTYIIDVECSGGTYIRTLVSDIAKKLGSLAYMSYLIRLRNGVFDINDSVTLDELQSDLPIIPIDKVLNDYARVQIEDKYHNQLINGVRIKMEGLPKGLFLVYINNRLFGLGHSEDDILITDIRFFE